MNRLSPPAFALALVLAAAGCHPAPLVSSSSGPPTTGTTDGTTGSDTTGSSGTSGTTGAGGGLCSPCQASTDCGEDGLALCVFETAADVNGHCAPVCVANDDCDPGSACTGTDSGTKVCYPVTGTCANGPTTSSSSSSSSSTGTTGTNTQTCGTKVGPDVTAGCTCRSGQTCTANGCFGGYWCETAGNHCIAPPSSGCDFGTTSTTSSTGTTTGSTGTTTGTTTGSGVGPQGGTVNLLHFGLSGDTRPPACEDTANYPTAIINAVGDAYRSKAVQFAVDLGDHMYVCNNNLQTATDQMNLFLAGTAHYGGTWFMTEGNHECWQTPCLPHSTNANYQAFLHALAPISGLPYYSVDVQTSKGLARFVFVADNSWDPVQSTWLDSTLASADTQAAYTIVCKHHPVDDTSVASNAAIMQIITAHKYALLLTGHNHRYYHSNNTDRGRDVVLGNAGAPLVASGTFSGYAIIDQQADGTLKTTVYDVSTNTPQDTFTVGPNP